MRSKVFITTLTATMMVVSVVSTILAAGAKPTLDSVSKAVICQCGGCNFPVGTCNHEECSSRDQMKAMAETEIAAGKSETAILQDFVLQYGVKVLAAPPATGFNLTVWILPGVGVFVGLVLVVILVKRWRGPLAGPPTPRVPVNPRLMDAVEEEMERLGMGH